VLRFDVHDYIKEENIFLFFHFDLKIEY